MEEAAQEQCIGGEHYIYDANNGPQGAFVKVGTCAQQHPEDAEPDPKLQVVNAAQNALNTVKGKGQPTSSNGPYLNPASAAAVQRGVMGVK